MCFSALGKLSIILIADMTTEKIADEMTEMIADEMTEMTAVMLAVLFFGARMRALMVVAGKSRQTKAESGVRDVLPSMSLMCEVLKAMFAGCPWSYSKKTLAVITDGPCLGPHRRWCLLLLKTCLGLLGTMDYGPMG